MNARVRGPIVAGMLIALTLAVPAPAVATTAVIDTAPEIASIEAPAPGHRNSWSMSVTNRSERAVPISLVVQGADGLLTNGPTPLLISISSETGEPVLDAAPAGDLIASSVALEPLGAGETRVLHGVAALPREADDRYQGVDGRITFRVTALGDVPTSGVSTLTRTGADLTSGFLLLGGLLLGGTVLIITGRRRRSHHG